ncbi:MAG: TIR domain-containing protein [Chloroflexota bacterium]|nr:TIR domain-containing protein [Chloroflexota bacterium]
MPVKIFCCYAREDELLLNKLKTHLVPLQRQGLIDIWHDRDITAGAEWEREIREHLNTAQIILLLVSPDFMDSDYCYSIEMKKALERHALGEARVIPIILRPVYWQGLLGKLQAVPKDALPVTDPAWHNIDRALYNVMETIYSAVEDLALRHPIEFSIRQGDITSFDADVLALKYAQEFFGTDEIIASLLDKVGISIDTLQPRIGDFRCVETHNCIQARHALFIGVPDIVDFNYQHVQEFTVQVLKVLANIAPATRHLAMTIHGAGFGLDEIEAFLAQFKGYLQALQSEQFPSHLEKITIIDRNLERIQRLRQAFEEIFSHANFVSPTKDLWTYRLDKRQLSINFKGNQRSTKDSEKVAITSEAKPHVFVAMPFKKDMDDVFYYGIQPPVRAAGFICERVDQEAFIGDILEQVKKKIETAVVVIAELTDANPDVYLEVGYAWGKGRPTILLMKNGQELRFDVRDQRCLKYESIRDLEESLKKEFNELKLKRSI